MLALIMLDQLKYNFGESKNLGLFFLGLSLVSKISGGDGLELRNLALLPYKINTANT
jgi:hypothetical protein